MWRDINYLFKITDILRLQVIDSLSLSSEPVTTRVIEHKSHKLVSLYQGLYLSIDIALDSRCIWKRRQNQDSLLRKDGWLFPEWIKIKEIRV